MSLQEALKLMRLELGLTQTDLAKKLDKTFITVNRWENGKAFPARNTAERILKIAADENVSQDCMNYLRYVLDAEARAKEGMCLIYPEIDRDFLFRIADGSNNSMYVIEAETHRLLYVNRAAEESARKSRLETMREQGIFDDDFTLQQTCYSYFGRRSDPCPFCPLKKGISSDEFTDNDIFVPGGKKVRVHAKKTEVNGKNAYIVYLTDITKDIQEQKSLYELTDNILQGVGIYSFFSDGHIELEFMNKSLFVMIGTKRRDEIIASSWVEYSIVHPDDKQMLYRVINKAVLKNTDFSVDLRITSADDKYSMCHITGRAIRKDKDKQTYYCVFTFIDEE